MFWKRPEFKERQAYWYDLLAQSGFKDIETNEQLKAHASDAYRNSPEPTRNAKCEYYLELSRLVKEKAAEFDEGIDYFVIYKLSLGLTQAQVLRELEGLGAARDKHTITYIRRKYEHRWGLRQWKPEQMKSRKVSQL